MNQPQLFLSSIFLHHYTNLETHLITCAYGHTVLPPHNHFIPALFRWLVFAVPSPRHPSRTTPTPKRLYTDFCPWEEHGLGKMWRWIVGQWIRLVLPSQLQVSAPRGKSFRSNLENGPQFIVVREIELSIHILVSGIVDQRSRGSETRT